jgi:hypothetical protein
MVSLRSDVECIVIPFVQRVHVAGLTARDRIEVARWQQDAHRLGYDRLVIHEREWFDPADVGSFLSIYRAGEPWARWGITRKGMSVLAWCSLTGDDFGPFVSVSDALLTILSVPSLRSAVYAAS